MDELTSSDFCPLLDGFVLPVDMNLAETDALVSVGELVARVMCSYYFQNYVMG